MIRVILLILLGIVFAGCDSFSAGGATENPVPPEQAQTIVMSTPPLPQYGEFSLEERILNTNLVVRATMNSVSSEVVVDPDEKYLAVLKYNFTVREYLKGSGPTSIVGVAVDGWPYDTRVEAESAKTRTLAARDAQWDDREAIIFLYSGASGFGSVLDTQLQRADHFLLAVGNRYSGDERYSLHSDENKTWLPATASGGSASGASSDSNGQEFLLDVPSQERAAGEGARGAQASSTTTPTISLSALKTRIGEVMAELNGGDGSDAYKACVAAKYKFERRERYFQDVHGSKSYDNRPTASELTSGQPAGTELYVRLAQGTYPDKVGRAWLEGRDAALFAVVLGEMVAVDVDGDGRLTSGADRIEYTKTLTTARPLPAGQYETTRKDVWAAFLACNYVLSNDWTVTVTAPAGTLHEAFFDPLAGTLGVPLPAEFTVGGVSTAVQFLDWENGTVTLLLYPYANLAGHTLDFIGMNGRVTLSLDAGAAVVDRAAGTLTWAVATQPWREGDQLMLRIRQSSSTATPTPTPTPTPIPPTATPIPPTPTPTPEPELPEIVTRYDANGDGAIDVNEYLQALRDYQAGKIEYSDVLEVGLAYQANQASSSG